MCIILKYIFKDVAASFDKHDFFLEFNNARNDISTYDNKDRINKKILELIK